MSEILLFCLQSFLFSYRDGGSGEGQTEQHQQGDDLVVGVNVGQTQTAVVAGEARLHRLEHVRPLQEVETDDGRHQDRQLPDGHKRGRAESCERVQRVVKTAEADGASTALLPMNK